MILFAASECCTACREGLSSVTCSAPWLEGETVLLGVFRRCCRQLNAVTTSTTAPSTRSTFPPLPVASVLSSSTHFDTASEDSRRNRFLWLFTRASPITCEQGYQYDRTLAKCVDIDECFLGKYSCPHGRLCLNLLGGYECSSKLFELQKVEVIPECPAGYFYSRHLQECMDRDECSSGESICSPDEVCMNLLGKFVCRSKSRTNCEPGYLFQDDHGCV
ncbi:latent-transforming growth factor beta-binding protein 4-like, partial [Tropilaelaps mercedesae]